MSKPNRFYIVEIAALVLTCALLTTPQLPAQDSQAPNTVPVYRITVVGRTVKAINFRQRGGSTKLDLVGTALMPTAHGSVQVRSLPGATAIDTDIRDLGPASGFGPEYLTYVLWAITPDGQTQNLGEVVLNGSHSSLHVTTHLQAFGLIVTAEPYFAVTQPSDVVVMQNEVRKDTVGEIEQVDAKYELLRRGQYTSHVSSSELTPLPAGPRIPLDLLEAQNAVRIARWASADKYASETFNKARQQLEQAEDYQARKQKKPVLTAAREATQTAADARLISLRRQDQEAQAAAKKAADARMAAAQAQAQAQQEAAERSREQAESAATARAQAEAAQANAEAQQAEAQADARRAQQAAQTADAQREQMRARLLQQLNSVLQTRDTPRGLVVTMSDVLFATSSYTLKPDTREKLAKLSGVLLAYPGLNLEIDGYTDSTGSEDFNDKLSQQRADSVRDYLIQQDVPANTVVAKGLGESNPVASNNTAMGRSQNRRVELVVSGQVIGTQFGHSAAAAPAPAQ